jgi:hypothetical protein
MCKTNMGTYFYYVNINKHEYEKNMTRLWCKTVLKTIVKYIKGNEGSYFYFIPFWGPSFRKLSRRFLCVYQVRKFFENLPN